MVIIDDASNQMGGFKAEVKSQEDLLNRYASLANIIPDALIAIDRQNRVIGWNPAAERMYGWTAQEALGQSVPDLFQTDFQLHSEETVFQAIWSEGFWSGEVNQRNKKGERIPVLTTISGVKDEKGDLIAFLGLNLNIREKKKAEKALFESEQKFSAAFNSAITPQAITNQDGVFVEANAILCDLIGIRREDLLGKVFQELEIISKTKVAEIIAGLETNSGSFANIEAEFHSRDGRRHTLLFSVETISLNGIPHFLATGVDITRRVQAEKQLARMERLYLILSQVNQTIVRVKNRGDLFQAICDVAVKYGKFELAWVALLDEPTGDLRPVAAQGGDITNWKFPIFNISTGPFMESLACSAVRSGQVITSDDLQVDERTAGLLHTLKETSFHALAAIPIHQSGKTIGVLVMVSPERGIFDDLEEIYLLEEMGTDISFALDAIETSRVMHQWADAFENTAHGIAIVVPSSGLILTCNPSYARMQGRTIEEISGMPAISMYAPQNHEEVKQAISRADRDGSAHYEALKIRKDGSTYPVQMDLVSVRDEKGNLLYRVATQIDLSERKQAEEALLSSERKLKLFVDYAPAAIAMLDRNMHYLAASKRYTSDYRLGDQDIIGRSHYEVFPDLPERWKEGNRRSLAGSVEKSEEDPFPRADGSLDWIRWESHPWYERSGQIGGIILFSEVITERKNARVEIQHRNQDLMLVQTLNDAANQGKDLDEIIIDFAKEMRTVFNCQDAAVYLLSPDGNYLEMQGATFSGNLRVNIEKLIGRKIPRIRLPLRKDGQLRRMLESEEGIITSNSEDIQGLIEEFHRHGFSAGNIPSGHTPDDSSDLQITEFQIHTGRSAGFQWTTDWYFGSFQQGTVQPG